MASIITAVAMDGGRHLAQRCTRTAAAAAAAAAHMVTATATATA